MIKSLITTLVLLFNLSIALSQTNILFKNINQRAKELKHDLNTSRDSLVLQSEGIIYKVEIFNDGFEKTIEVGSRSTKIPLQNLPEGRFIVETKLKDKLVIMTLVRKSNADVMASEKLKAISIDTRMSKMLAKDELVKYGNSKKLQKLPKHADVRTLNKIAKSYWVEYVISNGNSSYKTLRFASKALVDQMIAKNKIEVQSVKGKLNDLTIWEIYDTTKFLRFKRLNPNFSQTTQSEYFNVKPYYTSRNSIVGI